MTPQELLQVSLRNHQAENEYLQAIQYLLSEISEKDKVIADLQKETKRLSEEISKIQMSGIESEDPEIPEDSENDPEQISS